MFSPPPTIRHSARLATLAASLALCVVRTTAVAQDAPLDSSPAPGSPLPYSQATFRVGATAGGPTNHLRDYYRGGTGPMFELEMPFEFGNLGALVNAVTYHGKQPQWYDIKANVIAFDWKSRFLGSGPLRARVGLLLGDMHMRYGGPSAGVLLASEEMLGGPSADVVLHLRGPLSASVSASWLYSPSASRADLAYGSAALAYTAGVPDWLRHFLE